ncbi:MAG: hypothetical protein JSW50_06300 [Candidatus Latescibacterota bacterium]|nr:MAG: hypothetical protein JSW50_06300 [Candidatus Latescibacterota bacterium]
MIRRFDFANIVRRSTTCGTVFKGVLCTGVAAIVFALKGPTPVPAQVVGLESINYAFSTQLGSGIYTVNGRNIQIYRVSLARRLKAADADTWGYRLAVRTTLGFYNLKLDDILEQGIPDHVATLAILPELEFEAPRWYPNWHLLPFVGVGGGKDFQGGSFNYIFALGIRSRAIWPWGEKKHIRLGNQLVYSVATSRDVDFTDDFGMFETIVDVRRPLGFGIADHQLDASVYGGNYAFLISPRLIDVGKTELNFALNWEFGVTLGTAEPWKVLGLQLPRIGIGYRFDSQYGALRILIGESVPIYPPGERSATIQ